MPPCTVTTTVSEREHAQELLIKRQLEKAEGFIKEHEKYKNTIHTLWGTFDQPIRWLIVAYVGIYHILGIIALFTFPYFEKKTTVLWNYVLMVATNFSITAGVHRLWTHKSYKAKLPLQILYAILYTQSGHHSIYNWVRDHRVHHKFSDTNGDPFNINRGFFYSQIGFIFIQRHPMAERKIASLDNTDLLRDPVIYFFKRYYWAMQLIFHFLIPMGVPVYFWNESLYWSIMMSAIRFVAVFHITTAVNSVAHKYGTKPFLKKHFSVDNVICSFISIGEGYHNYHHAFPWDYKASEYSYYFTNFTTFMLDIFGKLGWAYDFKQASPELIRKFTMKNGDGSHPVYGEMEFEQQEQQENYKSHDILRW